MTKQCGHQSHKTGCEPCERVKANFYAKQGYSTPRKAIEQYREDYAIERMHATTKHFKVKDCKHEDVAFYESEGKSKCMNCGKEIEVTVGPFDFIGFFFGVKI